MYDSHVRPMKFINILQKKSKGIGPVFYMKDIFECVLGAG